MKVALVVVGLVIAALAEGGSVPSCWEKCGKTAGPCPDVCGPDKLCCRKGFIKNGCDGSVGGGRKHTCVPKPERQSFVKCTYNCALTCPDTKAGAGCNQMFSCPNACKMRDLGLTKEECNKKCVRTPSSGCEETVNGYKFKLCGPCFEDYREPSVEKEQCAKENQVDKWVGECKSGCSSDEVSPPELTCKPRKMQGEGCPWLPNMSREACLSALDSREIQDFKGQPCVWCTKDCEGKHMCEVKSRANPPENYEQCLLGEPTTTGGWLPMPFADPTP